MSHDSHVTYIDERFAERHAFAIKCTKEPYLLRFAVSRCNWIYRYFFPSVKFSTLYATERIVYPRHIDYCHLARGGRILENTRIDRFSIAQYSRFLFRVLPIN